jgi:hypothetical protein
VARTRHFSKFQGDCCPSFVSNANANEGAVTFSQRDKFSIDIFFDGQTNEYIDKTRKLTHTHTNTHTDKHFSHIADTFFTYTYTYTCTRTPPPTHTRKHTL